MFERIGWKKDKLPSLRLICVQFLNSVRHAATAVYSIVTVSIATIVAMGIERRGFLASSPAAEMASKPP